MLKSAKMRAAKKGLDFSITLEDIQRVWVDHCPVFGYELKMKSPGENHAATRNSPSLDRIDPTKGYVPGNIQILSHLANSMKSYATQDELEQFAYWILSQRNQDGTE